MTTTNTPTVFMNTEKFSVEVERRHDVDNKCTLLEHASMLLEEMGIDTADGQTLISRSLKERIRVQCSERNLLKERNTTLKLVL